MAPVERSGFAGAAASPGPGRALGVVLVFQELKDLQMVGPVWVREMLKRRPRRVGGPVAQMVPFDRGAHQTAGSSEEEG